MSCHRVMTQIGASLLELSIMILEASSVLIYYVHCTSVTYDDCKMFIVQVTDQRWVEYSTHNPKNKGLIPTTGTGLETTAKK